MPLKKRFCRFPMIIGLFCKEHQPSCRPCDVISSGGAASASTGDAAGHAAASARMPCPLDPKHTCDPRKLEAHLKVCPAKRNRLAMER